jgi:hypothetical protein
VRAGAGVLYLTDWRTDDLELAAHHIVAVCGVCPDRGLCC